VQELVLTHSEFNDSKTDEVNFLQLWIIPEEMNVEPHYDQRQFPIEDRINKLQTVVAPKDKQIGKALPISQQAYIYRTQLERNKTVELNLKSSNNGVYVIVVDGEIEISGNTLNKRDAMGISKTDTVKISAIDNAEVILIEVPMT
jgi:redox-sensitive bicupin YhaK (pirin superfamily)